MIKLLDLKDFIFEEIGMEKHQEEYIKLLDDKFNIVGEPRIATYKKHRDTIYRGIVVEVDKPGFITRLVFLADKPSEYFHKWAIELPSDHLPPCVWITRYTDSALKFIDVFYV